MIFIKKKLKKLLSEAEKNLIPNTHDKMLNFNLNQQLVQKAVERIDYEKSICLFHYNVIL